MNATLIRTIAMRTIVVLAIIVVISAIADAPLWLVAMGSGIGVVGSLLMWFLYDRHHTGC